MPKRLRLLIYTHDTQEQLERQRANDTVRHVWGHNRMESFELNPLRITIMELLRLFRRESPAAQEHSPREADALEALLAAEVILSYSPLISTNRSGTFRNITTSSVLAEVRQAIKQFQPEQSTDESATKEEL